MLRFSSGEEEPGIKTTHRRFDTEFIKEVIDNSNPDRVYVCGPSEMVKSVRSSLEVLNFDMSKTFFL